MIRVSKAARRIRTIAALGLAVCALGAVAAAPQAQAGGQGNYCGGSMPAGATCHGPWVNGLFFLAGEGSQICVGVQAWNGSSYYNVTGWACGNNPTYEFGTVNGYPSIYNNSGHTETVGGGLYVWH